MTNRINFTDLAEQAQDIWPDIEGPLRDAILGAKFIGGPEVEGFEAEWASYCGTGHAIGVANGTDAIHLALRAIGVKPGDEVIVPANTFVASCEAIVYAGAVPRFADVDPDTLLMTASSAAAAITPRTVGILPVHLYGQMADMTALRQVASRHGLFVIEDAAQAHGAAWGSERAGSIGDIGCFSFYPGKNLGAFGDAGAVVTNDPSLAARVRSLSNHGRAAGGHLEHEWVGTTSRLDALQAIVLRAKLKRLDGWTEQRRQIAAVYDTLLEEVPLVRRVAVDPMAHHVYHLYVVRVNRRDEIGARLSADGISTGVHYASGCHEQRAFAGWRREALPVVEDACAQVLSLPMSAHMTESDAVQVVERLKVAVEAERADVVAGV